MSDLILLVDTWEGGGAIDEAYLLAHGVSGMFVRINRRDPNTNSWLSKDLNFDKQWEQAKVFQVRIPYFVFDPKESGMHNYTWLAANMPPDAGAVALDIEVAGGTPTLYATETEKCRSLIKGSWNCVNYTGEGFLSMLNVWPSDEPYWWAQYPYSLYPDTPIKMSWDDLRTRLAANPVPLNQHRVPGKLMFWQCSGDRLIMDGCDKPMDVNVFYGTMQELLDFSKGHVTEIPGGEEHTYPYPGVRFHKIFRHNSWCHILIEPMHPNYAQHVTKFGLKTVSQVAREEHSHTVINGGAYNAYGAIGLHASEGVIYKYGVEYEPWVNFTKEQVAQINPYNGAATKWNSLAGKRFIVQDGKVALNHSAAWHEVHPRTLIGLTANKEIVKAVIDGRQPGYSVGVDLFQGAEIMIEAGCVVAIDLDGGGSSAMAIGGIIVNRPIDQGVPGKERAVGDHITMTIVDVAPPELPQGGTMDTYKVLVAVKPRPTPAISGGTSSNVPAGTTFSSSVEQDGSPTGTRFVQYTTGEWLPLMYNGVVYVEKVSAPQPANFPNEFIVRIGTEERRYVLS